MGRLLVVVAVLAGATAAAGSAAPARAPHGPLTGKWRGVLTDGTQKERITITVNGINGRLPGPLEVAIFRIVQEALTNVARHAHSTSAQVSIETNYDTLTVTVEDDGAGFNMDDSLLNDTKKTGLSTIRKRVEMFGGDVTVDSAPGRGTRVVATFPMEISL